MASHLFRCALCNKPVDGLLQRAQKALALLVTNPSPGVVAALARCPASRRAWPNERIWHHQTGQGLLPLVLCQCL